MKSPVIAFIISALLVSSLWLLAVADGTVDLLNSWIYDRTEINLLQEEIAALELEEKKGKLETLLLKHTIKGKVYQAQLDYLGSKGF